MTDITIGNLGVLAVGWIELNRRPRSRRGSSRRPRRRSPEVVEELEAKWYEEAEHNAVLLLFYTLTSRFSAMLGPLWPAGQRIELRGDSLPLNDEVLPLVFGGFTMRVTLGSFGSDGVLFSFGDHLKGFPLYLIDDHVGFTLAAPSHPTEVYSDLPIGQSVKGISVTYDPANEGILAIMVDDKVAATAQHPGMVPAAF